MRAKDDEARIEQRRKLVAANLLGGMNYRELAEVCGVSIGTISSDVKIILGRWRKEQVADTSDYAQMELRRLDKALNAIWNKVIDGQLDALDRFLRIQERRAKLLGLDAPNETQLSGEDGGPLAVSIIEVVKSHAGTE